MVEKKETGWKRKGENASKEEQHQQIQALKTAFFDCLLSIFIKVKML